MTTETYTTFSADEIEVMVHAAQSAYMTGYSFSTSLDKAREIYKDAPELHENFTRHEFMAVAARAIRGFYNLPYDQSEFSDVIRHVSSVYGKR